MSEIRKDYNNIMRSASCSLQVNNIYIQTVEFLFNKLLYFNKAFYVSIFFKELYNFIKLYIHSL